MGMQFDKIADGWKAFWYEIDVTNAKRYWNNSTQKGEEGKHYVFEWPHLFQDIPMAFMEHNYRILGYIITVPLLPLWLVVFIWMLIRHRND